MPVKDFLNRKSEVFALKHLPDLRENHRSGNILLEGSPGVGKTELLKQVYRAVYWDDTNVVPFYYSFKTASLKASIFAQDYYHQFVRQYLSFFSKDPSLIAGQRLSLNRAIPSSETWLLDLMDEFEELRNGGDFYDLLLAAVSAPVYAATRGSRPILILLDNFHLVDRLYEKVPGDFSGLVTLFETPMKMSLCPHVITGSSADTLESVFAESALRGTAERMILPPLPDDGAQVLFRSFCDKFSIKEDPKVSLAFMRFLGCNPFYIRSMARALARSHKKEASQHDLWECYCHEVSEGEIALYWLSILSEAVKDPVVKRAAVRAFMHIVETNGDMSALGRMPRILGVAESVVKEALSALKAGGFLQGTTGYKSAKDNVLIDVMQSLYMSDIEGKPAERIREHIASKYMAKTDRGDCFEVVLPDVSEAELIAAKALEQICSNLNLQQEVTERLQLALIEACINAMEHSGGLEKKVFLRFYVSGTRLEIAVESSGRFFDPDAVEDPEIEVKLNSAHKRGWGLKLIQSIMDEVRIERVDDRTRVLLIKNIKHHEVLHDANKL